MANGIDEISFLYPEFHFKTAILGILSVFCKYRYDQMVYKLFLVLQISLV